MIRKAFSIMSSTRVGSTRFGRRFRFSRWGPIGALLGVLALLATLVGPLPSAGAQGGQVLGAPTQVRATAGNGQVTLTWIAPTSDGGSSIIGWQYTYSVGEMTGDLTATNIWLTIPGSSRATTRYTVTQLTNGKRYEFKVRAVNAAGAISAASPASGEVIPSTVPRAPTNLKAVPSDSKIVLSWDAASGKSAASGFESIIRYEYQLKIGDGDYPPWSIIPAFGPGQSTYTVAGLTNGISYQFRVRAVNRNGPGATAETRAITSSSVPGKPRSLRAAPGDGSVTLSWLPSSDGGSSVVQWQFRVRASDENFSNTAWITVPSGGADTRDYMVVGLNNNKAYQFQVRAVNAVGAGAGAQTGMINPGRVPGVPTGLSGDPEESSVTLKWTPPLKGTNLDAGGGNSKIIRYEYSQKTDDDEWSEWKAIPKVEDGVNPDETNARVDTTSEQNYKISKLTAGVAYWFRVRAVNKTGAGGYVESVAPVFLGSKPSAPASVTAEAVYDVRTGVAQVVLSWTPGEFDGPPVDRWQFRMADSLDKLLEPAAKGDWKNICDNTGGGAPSCPSQGRVVLPRPPDLFGRPQEVPPINFELGSTYYFLVRALNSFYTESDDTTVDASTGGLVSAVAIAKFRKQVPSKPGAIFVKEYSIVNDRKGVVLVPTGINTGGEPILGYEYSLKVGGGEWGSWIGSETSPIVIFGLKQSAKYTVRIRALNILGPGAYEETPELTFGAPPHPGAKSVTASFDPVTARTPTLLAIPGSDLTLIPPKLIPTKVSLRLLIPKATSTGNAAVDLLGDNTETSTAGGGVDSNTIWEYSYTAVPGNYIDWTFVNTGEQFNDGKDLLLDGFENGTFYIFRVRAVNPGQPNLEGPYLESSITSTGVKPAAPLRLVPTRGDRQVTLTWESGGDGGLPIIKWQYCIYDIDKDPNKSGSQGGHTPGCTWKDVPNSGAGTKSYIVTGLTNGWAYTFQVRAVNAIGAFIESLGAGPPIRGLPVVPGRAPGVVGRVVVEPGDGEVSVWVAPPVDTGGVTVTGYEVRKKVAGGVYDAWEALGTSVRGTSSARPSAERGSGAVVKNLVNGVGYTFQVRAKNAFGVGPEKESSVVVPVGSPTAGELRAEAGDARVVLSWSAGDAGGSTVTEWQYRQQPGDGGYGPWVAIADSDAETATHTVTGLSNGISYTFQIRALTPNRQVTGDPFESPPVTPATVPPPPVGLTATRGDESVTLSWAPGVSGRPGQDDYAATTTGWQYRMKTANGDFGEWADIDDSDADTTSHDVTDLTNGVAYTFDIRAVNTMGNGAAASATATPATVPSAPEVTVTAANRMVTLEWTATGNGGTPITGWQLRTNDGEWADLDTTEANSVPLPNLTNGVAYAFDIRAVNAVGAGAAASVTATPAGTPPAPTVTSTRGNSMVTLSWTSEGDGGSSITGWQVRTDDGEWVDLTTLDLDVDAFGHEVIGLTNGIAYTFGVRALNAKGNGAAASVQATPAAAPAAPDVTVNAGDGEITLSWASDDDGGSAITGWQYRTRIGVGTYGQWTDMGADATGTSLTGLDSGTGVVAYTFQVRAINVVGAGTTTTTDSVIPVETSTVEDEYYSGVIDGPNFCTRFSLGGARLFALDSNGDGVADTCSLPYTRREAIARRSAVVTLTNRHADEYQALVNAACATLEGDEPCGGEVLSPPEYPPVNDGGPYYSGIVTGPAYCANRSLGGPTTYPLDSNGDGVADICSLPYTRREAIARQIAGDTLAAMYLNEFKNLLTEECLRLSGTDYGDNPADLAADICTPK